MGSVLKSQACEFPVHLFSAGLKAVDKAFLKRYWTRHCKRDGYLTRLGGSSCGGKAWPFQLMLRMKPALDKVH